jgi:hypothetical protein
MAEVVAEDPTLVSRRPQNRPGGSEEDWERYGFTKRSLRLLDAWEMTDGNFTVAKRGSYLGPDEGRTFPKIGAPSLKQHDWFAANP